MTQPKDQPGHTGHHRHWHYIYHKRRRRALGISSKQMALSQVVSLIGSVVAGVLLESNKTTLALVAGAFVVLPGIFDLDGTLGAVLSAKINHRMSETSDSAWRVFSQTVGFALFIAALAGLIVAAVGGAIASLLFDASYVQVFILAFGAIMLSGLIGFPLIGALAVLFRLRGINPDDVVGPIESSVFDILTIVTMVLIIGWLL